MSHLPGDGTFPSMWPCNDACCQGITPGGTTNRVTWDEKGVLDSYVRHCAVTPAPASLPANHDSYKQGIYTTNSIGDFD